MLPSSAGWQRTRLTWGQRAGRDNFYMTARALSGKEYWDIRARSFPGYRSGNEFQARVLETIQNHGVDFSGAHLLDLGCGAGSYTIPFARIAKRVSALDISSVMLERLRSQAAALGIANISTLESDWAEYEVKEKFDIIFCSRCPAMADQAALRKVCNALTKWGILFHFAKDVRPSDTHIMGGALLELHGVERGPKKNFGALQDWLRDDSIPFAVYPLTGENRAYHTLDELTTNAEEVLEAAGATPDPQIIRNYLEQFRDDASGKYISTTRYDMELVIWRKEE